MRLCFCWTHTGANSASANNTGLLGPLLTDTWSSDGGDTVWLKLLFSLRSAAFWMASLIGRTTLHPAARPMPSLRSEHTFGTHGKTESGMMGGGQGEQQGGIRFRGRMRL